MTTIILLVIDLGSITKYSLWSDLAVVMKEVNFLQKKYWLRRPAFGFNYVFHGYNSALILMIVYRVKGSNNKERQRGFYSESILQPVPLSFIRRSFRSAGDQW